MKKIAVFVLLILVVVLTSCSSIPRFKTKDGVILYDNNEYFDTDFYVTERGGAINPNGDLELIGLYPCEMALYLPKPIYKMSNDKNNELLFVYGVGEPLYVFAKSDFIAPDYSNFKLSSIECEDFCLDFKNGETIDEIYDKDKSFSRKELEIKKKYECMAYSNNYPLFIMIIRFIIDLDDNVYIEGFDSFDYYLLKENYRIPL